MAKITFKNQSLLLTINDFRGKILKDKIKAIFAQVVKMLVELGYVSPEVQYIDSTK